MPPDLIMRAKPDLVLVFGADHIYFMDVRHDHDASRYHVDASGVVALSHNPSLLIEG
ncbi:MAG: hypothetical protein JRI46_05480 [Deltaproteobacteria bacterium]|nr:hypothetical protein [Deltaproteobacteria bacterium]